MSQKPSAQRRDQALIHMYRQALGMSRDAYEDLLHLQFGGATSSTQLNAADRAKLVHMLIEKLRREQPEHAKLPKARPGRPGITGADTPRGQMMTKIEALLTDAGLPWSYAASVLLRMTGGNKDRLQFATAAELTSVITALEKAALKRLHAEAATVFGPEWHRPVFGYACALFGFSRDGDIRCYTQPVSLVLRWYRGDIQVHCDWPPQSAADLRHCCRGCLHRATDKGDL